MRLLAAFYPRHQENFGAIWQRLRPIISVNFPIDGKRDVLAKGAIYTKVAIPQLANQFFNILSAKLNRLW